MYTLLLYGIVFSAISYLLDQCVKKAEAAALESRQLTVVFVIVAVILLIFLCVQAFRNPPRVYDYLSKEMLDDDAPDEFEYELDML